MVKHSTFWIQSQFVKLFSANVYILSIHKNLCIWACYSNVVIKAHMGTYMDIHVVHVN